MTGAIARIGIAAGPAALPGIATLRDIASLRGDLAHLRVLTSGAARTLFAVSPTFLIDVFAAAPARKEQKRWGWKGRFGERPKISESTSKLSLAPGKHGLLEMRDPRRDAT